MSDEPITLLEHAKRLAESLRNFLPEEYKRPDGVTWDTVAEEEWRNAKSTLQSWDQRTKRLYGKHFA